MGRAESSSRGEGCYHQKKESGKGMWGNQAYFICLTILPRMAGPPQFNPEEGGSQERSDLLIMGQEGENNYCMNKKKHVHNPKIYIGNILTKHQRISKFVWDITPCGRDNCKSYQ